MHPWYFAWISALWFFGAGGAIAAGAPAPGGFLEADTPATTRAPVTATAMRAFVPAGRGEFTMPAPFNTRAWKITDAADCADTDCVGGDIYNYWPLINANAGQPVIYVVAGLKGHGGLTLYKIEKASGAVTKVGPLFTDRRKYLPISWAAFSLSKPDIFYYKNGSALQSINVVTHATQTIFDSKDFEAGTTIIKPTADYSDDTFAAILEHNGQYKDPYARIGCLVYHADTQKFRLFTKHKQTHQCSIGKAGKYIAVTDEKPLDACTQSSAADTYLVRIATGTYIPKCDKTQGGGGHHDLGYGWLIEADNWGGGPFTKRLWDPAYPLTEGLKLPNGNIQGGIVYQGASWEDNPGGPHHVSWNNAKPASERPIRDQYACGSGYKASDADVKPHDGVILCWLMNTDTPRHVLVVAPTLVNFHGKVTYGGQPKGNIDASGQYFLWVSNHGTSRLDVFLVEIPYRKLIGAKSWRR